jgi:hypothetical protein
VLAKNIGIMISKGDRSAVDVLLSSGPMRVVVLEVHNPSPKIRQWKVWVVPELWKQNCSRADKEVRVLRRWDSKASIYKVESGVRRRL